MSDLLDAFEENNITKFKQLLQTGVTDINQTYHYGFTLLIAASYFNKIDFVKLLIKNNADLNIKNSIGNTALDMAFLRCKDTTEIMYLLIEAGINVNSQNKRFGNTILLKVCEIDNRFDLIKKLIDYNVDVNLNNYYDQTPLVWACKNDYPEYIKLLVLNGATVDYSHQEILKYKEYIDSFSWTYKDYSYWHVDIQQRIITSYLVLKDMFPTELIDLICFKASSY